MAAERDDEPARAIATPTALADDLDDAPPVRPYHVHLPGFDGPLDLLLHLIEKNQLEITAISLVTVTDQFIQYLKLWDEPPLPRLAEFVAMAARLLLIKSRSLLPRQNRADAAGDADSLDDAETLRRHLVEYKMAREIATMLRAREIAGLQSYARPSRLVDPEALLTWAPPRLVGLDVNALAAVFRRVLAAQRLAEPEELPPPLVTVAEKIAEVEALLRARPTALLEDVLRGAGSRFAVVVTFLAVLELWHQARLSVTQETLFGPIAIRPGPKFGERTVTSFEPPAPEPEAPTEPAHPSRARRAGGR